MLNRILAIMRREYLERVKTKAFWISTLLVPVFLGAVMIIPAWLAARGGGDFKVGVLDFTGRFTEPVRVELGQMLERQTSTTADALEETGVVHGEQAEAIGEMAEESLLKLDLVSLEPGSDPEAARERAKQDVQNGRLDGK